MSEEYKIYAMKKGDQWFAEDVDGSWSTELEDVSVFTDRDVAIFYAEVSRGEVVAIHDEIKKQVLQEVRQLVLKTDIGKYIRRGDMLEALDKLERKIKEAGG